MGKIRNGILGPLSASVGNLTGARTFGKSVIRRKSDGGANPRTPGQIAQRSALSEASEYCRENYDEIIEYVQPVEKKGVTIWQQLVSWYLKGGRLPDPVNIWEVTQLTPKIKLKYSNYVVEMINDIPTINIDLNTCPIGITEYKGNLRVFYYIGSTLLTSEWFTAQNVGNVLKLAPAVNNLGISGEVWTHTGLKVEMTFNVRTVDSPSSHVNIEVDCDSGDSRAAVGAFDILEDPSSFLQPQVRQEGGQWSDLNVWEADSSLESMLKGREFRFLSTREGYELQPTTTVTNRTFVGDCTTEVNNRAIYVISFTGGTLWLNYNLPEAHVLVNGWRRMSAMKYGIGCKVSGCIIKAKKIFTVNLTDYVSGLPEGAYTEEMYGTILNKLFDGNYAWINGTKYLISRSVAWDWDGDVLFTYGVSEFGAAPHFRLDIGSYRVRNTDDEQTGPSVSFLRDTGQYGTIYKCQGMTRSQWIASYKGPDWKLCGSPYVMFSSGYSVLIPAAAISLDS